MARSELPAHITLQPKMGMFEPEDLVYLMLAIALAMYAHWAFLPAGLAAIFKYNRFRSKKPRGYTMHVLYDKGIIVLKGYPLGTQRVLMA